MTRRPRRPLHPFAAELLRRRKNRGLTQAALAQELFVARETVCVWETRAILPPLDSLERWAAALDMEVVLRPRVRTSPIRPPVDPRHIVVELPAGDVE